MKKTSKLLTSLMLVLILVVSMLSITGCGKTELVDVYSYQTHDHTQERGIDWRLTYDYTVRLYSDNTYELSYKYTGANTRDQQPCGEQHTISFGTYAIVDDPEVKDAEDNVDGVIITLDAPTRVIHYQHLRLGKYFGGEYFVDSATTEWNDALIENTGLDTVEEFVAEKSATYTIKALKSTKLITSFEKGEAPAAE